MKCEQLPRSRVGPICRSLQMTCKTKLISKEIKHIVILSDIDGNKKIYHIEKIQYTVERTSTITL
jgi:hypothetical protein